jgi:hypothetical protein
MKLTAAHAARFAAATLSHLGQEYPYKMDLVLNGPQDALPPREHHPIFHGSFDWHSCVHGWWQVLRLARRFPDLAISDEISARADTMLVPDKVAGELAFLDRPYAAGFERPYGWAWYLALHVEAEQHRGKPWAIALEPLAAAFAARFHDFLPKLTYPLRVGTHFNISFALLLARHWAISRDAALVALIDDCARRWFVEDRDCQAWEPGGDEFLSPALTEAHLMAAVLGDQFTSWFDAFLPRSAQCVPATLFAPAIVSDRSDGKIAHLDGLNLSRAWCWRAIATALGSGHPVHAIAAVAATHHFDIALPHVTGDYMGEHWLASFALLALDGL